MDQQRIKELIELVGKSDLMELTLSESGSTLHLSRQPGKSLAGQAAVLPEANTATTAATETPASRAVTPPPASTMSTTSTQVCSPLYGILHLTPSPEEPAFVAIGDTVTTGQILCVVEAMKMFHQVKATADGVLDAQLAETGTEVDTGQPLFRILLSGN